MTNYSQFEIFIKFNCNFFSFKTYAEFIIYLYSFYGHFEAHKKLYEWTLNNNAVLNFNYTFVLGPFYRYYIKTYLQGIVVNLFKIHKVKENSAKFRQRTWSETNLHCQIDWHIKTGKSKKFLYPSYNQKYLK